MKSTSLLAIKVYNKMNKKILLFQWTIFILTGCNFNSQSNTSDNSEFKIEKIFPNGQSEFVYKQFDDTVVNGKLFSYKLMRQLDTLGQLLREGFYLNDQAYGIHKFYQDNEINVLREYILFSDDQINLLNIIDSITSESLSPNNTYLNSVYYIENNDTVESKSSFYKIIEKSPLKRKDSIMVHIEFFEPQLEIEAYELFFDVPGDTSMIRMVTGYGNNLDFKQPILGSGKQNISGFALLKGYTIDQSSRDTFVATRFIHYQQTFEK